MPFVFLVRPSHRRREFPYARGQRNATRSSDATGIEDAVLRLANVLGRSVKELRARGCKVGYSQARVREHAVVWPVFDLALV